MRRSEVLAVVGAALTVGGAACSSPSAPRLRVPYEPPYLPAPTLFLRNPTCTAGVCQEIWIGGFLFSLLSREPEAPWGVNLFSPDHGMVRGPAACLTFLPRIQGSVTEVDSHGNPVWVDPVLWRPDDPEGVYLTVLPLGSMTETFIPTDSPGWDLTFTADSASGDVHYTAHVSPDTACVAAP